MHAQDAPVSSIWLAGWTDGTKGAVDQLSRLKLPRYGRARPKVSVTDAAPKPTTQCHHPCIQFHKRPMSGPHIWLHCRLAKPRHVVVAQSSRVRKRVLHLLAASGDSVSAHAHLVLEGLDVDGTRRRG